jgi:hypothetical protein
VNYPSICTQCYQPVDLDWFAKEKAAGRLPVVHACGKVLYRGIFAHIGMAGLEAEEEKATARLKSTLPPPVGTKGVHLASPAPSGSTGLPALPTPTTPSLTPSRQTRPCQQCGKPVVVERSTKRFCGGSCRKLASRKRLKANRRTSGDVSR